MKNNWLIIIIVAVFFCAGGFFAGMKFQQGKRPTSSTFNQFRMRQGERSDNQISGSMRVSGRQVVGEIINQDDKSITVKLNDKSSKIIFLADKMSLSKSSEADKTDLKVGERVAVFGIENSDGTVSAQNIQINPIMRNINNPSPKPQ